MSAIEATILPALYSAVYEAFVPGFVGSLLQRRLADSDICGYGHCRLFGRQGTRLLGSNIFAVRNGDGRRRS